MPSYSWSRAQVVWWATRTTPPTRPAHPSTGELKRGRSSAEVTISTLEFNTLTVRVYWRQIVTTNANKKLTTNIIRRDTQPVMNDQQQKNNLQIQTNIDNKYDQERCTTSQIPWTALKATLYRLTRCRSGLSSMNFILNPVIIYIVCVRFDGTTHEGYEWS